MLWGKVTPEAQYNACHLLDAARPLTVVGVCKRVVTRVPPYTPYLLLVLLPLP